VDEVEIVFSDSGPGVEAAFRDAIFDPYFSTKPDGVGLGLTIAGEIVNAYYAGDLELLDSGPLQGATFRITLRTRV
jgi:C4-dicarboxylate-specific signal transduction histidine kinase